jgi:glycosyltransferase involved in cell wall biosynthesis
VVKSAAREGGECLGYHKLREARRDAIIRIALVTHTFLPRIGGRETYVAKLAENLCRLGDDVVIVTTGFGKEVEKTGEIVIIRLPSMEMLLSGSPMRLTYRIIPRLLGTLMTLRFDVVQAHDLEQFSTYMAALAAHIKKKPMVLAITGLGPLTQPVSTFAKLHNSVLGRILITAAKAVIVGSKAKEKELGLQGKRGVFVVPFHGTEIKDDSSIHTDQLRLLVCARMIPRKGFQVAIRAFSDILAVYPGARLVLVGPDEGFRPQLEELSRKLRLTQSIEFAGPATSPGYEDQLKRSYIVIVPSLYESEPPLVMLDSMARSKPIIASSTDGISEVIVHEQNGLLFPPGDHKRLSQAVVRLIGNDSLRRQLSENARQTALNFSWPNIADATRAVYRQAIAT